MSASTAAVLQVLLLALALAACVVPLGTYLARVYESDRHWRVETALYRVLRVDPNADQRWSAYLMSVLGFSLASVLVLFGFGRLQQFLPLDNEHVCAAVRRRLEHGREFRDQHELAVVLRRGHHRPPDDDGRAHGSELRQRRRRHGRRGGLRTQPRPNRGRRSGRQLLERPDPGHLPSPAPHRLHRSPRVRRARRGAEPDVPHRGQHHRWRVSTRHRRTDREPGGYQGTRHQRRGYVQRQLGASLREPNSALEHLPDLPDPAHPVRHHSHLRNHRRRHSSGLGGSQRDGRPTHRVRVPLDLGRDGRSRFSSPGGGSGHGG